MTIRDLAPGDREAVHEMLVASPAFSEEEVRVAMEMVESGDYPAFVAEVDATVQGYVCIGATPLTRSTWHIYWICVHPRAQRCGIGQALEAHIERFIRDRHGERIVLETSGRPDYEPQRRFYERSGYEAKGNIKDYFKPGDDCVIYCKSL